MNLGEKIKNARKARKMTQSALAGDVLTRNMISRIESGNAKPSLDTLLYISERLGVPASYILSEDTDLFFYEKRKIISQIYEAFSQREYSFCTKKIKSLSRVDDELAYIMTVASFEIGCSAVKRGSLHTALRYLYDVEKYSALTRISTLHITAPAELYRAVALNIQSPLLEFEESKYKDGAKSFLDFEFYKYVVMDYDYDYTEAIYKNHVEAKKLIEQRKYPQALKLLKESADSLLSENYNALILFRLYSDIETCCKEMRDFEGAYKYANKRLSMLEGFKT